MSIKGSSEGISSPSLSHALLASFSSGCLSTGVGFPLETMRIRLLLGNQIGQLSTLNRGLSLGLSLSVIKAGGVWPLQEAMKKYLDQHQIGGGYQTLVSGGVSNIVPNCLLAPGNIIRVHLMRDRHPQPIFSVAQAIFQKRGILGFYQGVAVTIVRDFVWGTLYFPAVNKIGKAITDHSPTTPPLAQEGLSSFGAAAYATSLTAWIDATRLHVMNKDRVRTDSLLKIIQHSLVLNRTNILATFLGILRVSLAVTMAHTSYRQALFTLEKTSLF